MSDGADDSEEPLPEGEHRTDASTFQRSCALFGEPIQGRLKREFLRAGVQTNRPLARVRTAADVSRAAVGKPLDMALVVDTKIMAIAMPDGPRPLVIIIFWLGLSRCSSWQLDSLGPRLHQG